MRRTARLHCERTNLQHELRLSARSNRAEMECDGYQPMPSRRVQVIELSGHSEARPIVAAQFLPSLASFFFCLFVCHRGGPDSPHARQPRAARPLREA